MKTFSKVATLPISVDLRGKMPPVYDQGALGSCTGNALACAFEYDDKNIFQPSRLFIYYNERNIEGTVSSDSGALISDGIKSLETYGVCPETLGPYDISKFADKPHAN
jgi:C1A family cysteine protease